MSDDTNPVRLTKTQQAWVEEQIQKHLAEAKTALVEVDSKPEHVAALAGVWRRSKEHYQAQIFRFLGIFGALFGGQVLNDFIAGKPLFDGVTTPRAILAYIAGIAFLAWKQYQPSLTPKQANSAPGVTIVPEQVGVSTTPEVVVGVEEVPDGGAAAS